MKNRRLAALILAGAMAASLAACGQKTDAPSETKEVSEQAEQSPTGDGITITVYHYMPEASKQAGLDAVEKAFEDEHPEYHITWNNVCYNFGTDYLPQLQTALASGDQPEIIMGTPAQTPDIIEQGFAADLTENEVIKGLNLPSGDLGNASSNGRVYGFPIDFKTWGVFYNKDIYEELGLSEPKTHTELLENCQKIADAGMDPWVNAYSDAVFPAIEMRNYVWTKGIENGDFDMFENIMNGTKKVYEYDCFREGLENWAKRMQWMRDDALSNDQTAALEVFASGQAAQMFFGSWGIGDLESMIAGTDFRYGFFIEPIDDEGSAKMNVQVDQNFMVNPNAENYDIALEFMEYWMVDGAGSWSAVSMMPLLSGAVADNVPDIVKTLAEIKASGNIASLGDFTAPFNAQFNTDFRAYVTEFAESYLNGTNQSPEECLKNMQEKFDQDIAEAE